MQFAAFGDLNLSAEQFFNGLGKWLTDIATVGKDALNSVQISSAAAKRKQGAFAVSHIGGRHRDGVRQSLSIDDNVTLDPRDFFAGIIALLSGTIRVLDALCVDDQKARRGFAPLSCTSLANSIFLKPAPGR